MGVRSENALYVLAMRNVFFCFYLGGLLASQIWGKDTVKPCTQLDLHGGGEYMIFGSMKKICNNCGCLVCSCCGKVTFDKPFLLKNIHSNMTCQTQ